MRFRPEVIPFLLGSLAAGLVLALIIRMAGGVRPAVIWGGGLAVVGCVYMLWFFRDPVRTPPEDPDLIVSAAEGRVASIVPLTADAFSRHGTASGLKLEQLEGLETQDVIRISVFLSPMNVHVNRSPIDGQSRFLGYFPGKHIFTFDEKSSEENQHNAILITGTRTRCLVNQIVGPVCRRVVYFLDHEQPVAVKRGDRIGMMKFGSRLDHYFPAADIDVLVKPGDMVRAGQTAIARLDK